MKFHKRAAALVLAAVLTVLAAACSKTENKTALRIGLEDISPVLNPFCEGTQADDIISSQIFETVLRPGAGNVFTGVCGAVTYEELENNGVKYTVSIDDDILFSDGTNATIDDVIFYYLTVCDASFDGAGKEILGCKIKGLQEYYYDDVNYKEALEEIRADATDEKGNTYGELVEKYIKKNYSDGVDVPSISGIAKINDHSCTVTVEEMNINNIALINPVVVPKAVYGAGYTKGSADKVVKNKSVTGSGPYALVKAQKGSVSLEENKFYHGEKANFKKLEFKNISGKNAAQAVSEGGFDCAYSPADASVMSGAEKNGLASMLTLCEEYNTVFLNCKTLSPDVRRGVACLVDRQAGVSDALGDTYTSLFRPLSCAFEEYPTDVTEPYYTQEKSQALKYFTDAGYTLDNGVLKDKDGKQLKLRAVCTQGEESLLYKAFSLSAFTACGIDISFESSESTENADIIVTTCKSGATSDKYEICGTTGSKNICGLSDEKADELCLEVRSLSDINVRREKCAEMLDYLMSLACEIPLWQQKQVWVYDPEVITADMFEFANDPMGMQYIFNLI